jgi:hypothetical protein
MCAHKNCTCGNCGAEPTRATVRDVIFFAIALTSALNVSGFTGTYNVIVMR